MAVAAIEPVETCKVPALDVGGPRVRIDAVGNQGSGPELGQALAGAADYAADSQGLGGDGDLRTIGQGDSAGAEVQFAAGAAQRCRR